MNNVGLGELVVFTPEIQQRLIEIATLWNAVEGELKRAERIRQEIVVGAINELRYAGRLAVDAITVAGSGLPDAEKLAKLDQITIEIKNNCIRARADITDAIVLFFHEHLALNVEEFGMITVMQCFPQYSEMAAQIETVNGFMAKSRLERHSRQDIYAKIFADHLPALEKLYQAMEAVTPRLLSEIDRQERLDRRNHFFGKWGFYLGIASLIAGTYLALAAFKQWWPLAP